MTNSEDQQLSLLKQRQQHSQRMLELEKKKGEMRKDLNEQEMRLLDQEMAFCQLKMNCLLKISEVMNEKDRFNEFRSSCLKIVRHFNKFEGLFKEDVATLKSILKAANPKLNKPEKLMDASEALQTFTDNLQSLNIIKDREVANNLPDLQENLLEKSEQLRNFLEEMIAGIDVCMDDKSPESVAEIKTQYEKAESEVSDLNKIVPEFNIPKFKRFEKVMFHQMKIMTDSMSQIANSPTTLPIEECKAEQPVEIAVQEQSKPAQEAPVRALEPTEIPAVDPKIEEEEVQMNVLTDLMGTITNLSSLLENDQDPEKTKTMVADMRDMFSGVTALFSDGDEDDPEMMQIRFLLQAIMDLTKEQA